MICHFLSCSNLNNIPLIGIIAQRYNCNSDVHNQELGTK